jgi:hypothetical protein
VASQPSSSSPATSVLFVRPDVFIFVDLDVGMSVEELLKQSTACGAALGPEREEVAIFLATTQPSTFGYEAPRGVRVL